MAGAKLIIIIRDLSQAHIAAITHLDATSLEESRKATLLARILAVLPARADTPAATHAAHIGRGICSLSSGHGHGPVSALTSSQTRSRTHPQAITGCGLRVNAFA